MHDVVQDLETLAAGQKSELESLTERAERLVGENERLREGQIRDLDALVQQTGADRGLSLGGGGAGGAGVGAREMIDELNERISILMAENALLADQTNAMGSELERVHGEVDAHEDQNAALSKALSEAGVALRSLEEQVRG